VKENPELKPQAEEDLKTIEVAISTPEEDFGVEEPEVVVEGGIGVELDSKEKVNCKVCLKPYTLLRRKKNCERCNKEACTSCADRCKFSVLGWLSPKFVCKSCFPEIKLEIEAKVKENPQLKPQAEKELKLIDLALLPLPEEEDKELGVGIEGGIGLGVEANIPEPNPTLKIVTTKNPSEGVEKEPKEVEIGVGVEGGIGLKVDVNKPSKEKKPKEKKEKERCTICSKGYSLFKRKKKCDNCSEEICSGCSGSHKFTVLGWKAAKIICKTCLPKLKIQIEETGKKDPKKLSIALKEGKLIDSAISKFEVDTEIVEPSIGVVGSKQQSLVDAVNPKEDPLKGKSVDSIGLGIVFDSKKKDKNKTRCPICSSSFSISLKTKTCFQCKDRVCIKCVAKLKLPLPSWEDKNYACLSCAPSARFKASLIAPIKNAKEVVEMEVPFQENITFEEEKEKEKPKGIKLAGSLEVEVDLDLKSSDPKFKGKLSAGEHCSLHVPFSYKKVLPPSNSFPHSTKEEKKKAIQESRALLLDLKGKYEVKLEDK